MSLIGSTSFCFAHNTIHDFQNTIAVPRMNDVIRTVFEGQSNFHHSFLPFYVFGNKMNGRPADLHDTKSGIFSLEEIS